MISALWFYGLRSTRNRIVKRARDARYLIGFALAAAYLFWFFGATSSRPAGDGNGEAMGLLLTVFLVIVAVLTWFVQIRDHPLALTRPQAQALIPAPLSSRELMLVKMLTALPQMIWSAVILGLMVRVGFFPHPAARIIAVFVVTLAIQLQRVGAALVRGGGATGARSVALVIVRAWLVAAVVVCLAQAGSLAAANGLFGLEKTGIPFSMANESPWSLPLWPFRALLAPAYAATLAQFAAPFGLALLVVACEAVLVFQMSPEWDRVGIARTMEERLSARRITQTKDSAAESLWQRYITSFLKRPATALAWKNLLSAARTQHLSPQVTMVVGIPVLLAVTLLPPLHDLTSFLTGVASAWAGLLIFLGPSFVRNDLRLDLPRLRLLRTYPLTSLEICAAEVGASVSVLTLLQLVLLILSTGALLLNPVLPLPAGERLVFAIALACLLPGMNAINISAQNVFAIVFPKWVTLGLKRPSRAPNPGQFYISLLISAGLFLLSMIVPVIGAGVVAYLLRPLGNSIAIISGALVAGAVALVEAGFLIKWMASLLDRVDVTSVEGE